MPDIPDKPDPKGKVPANTTLRSSVGLMLGQRRRRLTNITLGQIMQLEASTRMIPVSAGTVLGQRRRRWPIESASGVPTYPVKVEWKKIGHSTLWIYGFLNLVHTVGNRFHRWKSDTNGCSEKTHYYPARKKLIISLLVHCKLTYIIILMDIGHTSEYYVI